MDELLRREDLKDVVDRIDALMIELATLRSRMEAAQQRELRPRELEVDRRRGDRRQHADRRRDCCALREEADHPGRT